MAIDKQAVLAYIDAAQAQRSKLYDEGKAKGFTGLATAKLTHLTTLYGDTIRHLAPPGGQHLASLERALQHPINSDRDRKELLNEMEGVLAALRSGYENGIISTERFTKAATLSALHRLENILNHFGEVARQLKRRHGKRSTITVDDEYDVQDLLHSLLLIEFDDVREEDPTPIHSGGSSRIDFVLKRSVSFWRSRKPERGWLIRNSVKN